MQLYFLLADIDAWLFYDGEQVVDELDEMAKGKKSFGFGDKGKSPVFLSWKSMWTVLTVITCFPLMRINVNSINSNHLFSSHENQCEQY